MTASRLIARGSCQRLEAWLSCFIVSSVAAITLSNAISFPVSHDEATTFLRFVATGEKIFSRDQVAPNNHLLFSVLSWVSVKTLGPSLLAFRFPSVVAAIAYLFLLPKLSELLCRRVASRLAMTLLGSTTPLVFSFLPLARGYSLGLALSTLAVVVMLRELKCGASSSCGVPIPPLRGVLIGLFAGLSVAANLSFAYLNLAWCGIFVFLRGRHCWNSGWHTALRWSLRSILLIGLPAVVVVVPTLWVLLGGVLDTNERGGLTGATSLFEGSRNLVILSVGPFLRPWAGSITRTLLPALVVLFCVVLCTTGFAVLRSRDRDGANARSALFIGGVVVGLTGVVLGAKLGALPYPKGRTGIHLVFGFVVALVACIEVATDRASLGNIGRYLRAAFFATLCTVQVGSLPSVFQRVDNSFDQAGRETVWILQQRHQTTGKAIVVGVELRSSPGLRFYKQTRGLEWLSVVTINPFGEALGMKNAPDAFLVFPEYESAFRNEPFEKWYIHSGSGLTLYSTWVR